MGIFKESGLFSETGTPINPMTPALSLIIQKMSQREFKGIIASIDSIIAIVIYLVIILLFIPLWCFCIIAYIEELLRDLIADYIRSTKFDSKNGIEKFASMIAIGFMGLLWIPTLILCTPIALVGGLTSYFTRTKKRIVMLIVLLIICGLIVFVVPNWPEIADWFQSLLASLNIYL